MGYQLLKEDILFYQRFLKANGFYTDTLDGKWGKNTNKADADFIAASAAIATELGSFHPRSEANIITLIPRAQAEARKFLQLCKDNNKDVRIISGTRTYAEQDELYAQGRTKPGKIVTYAKGGQSNHNFGLAWDIGLFGNNGYNQNDADYIALAHLIMPAINTIEWGGNWQSLKDYPHYQLKAVSTDVAILQRLFEDGEVYA